MSLSGLPPIAPGGADSGAAAGWLTGVTFEVSEASVSFQDARSGRIYRISHVRLAMRLGPGGNLTFAGGARLPPGVGRRVQVAAQVHGLTSPGGRWGGRVYVELAAGRLNATPLRDVLTTLPQMRGVVNTQLWSTWKDGRLDRLVGHVSISQFDFVTLQKATRSPPPALRHLSGDFALTRVGDGWQLAAKHLRAGDAVGAWPESAFSLAEQNTAAGRRLYGWAEFLRIQDMVPFLTTPEWLPAKWRARLHALRPRGDITALRFDATLPANGPPRLRASARLHGVGMRAQGAIPGVEGLSGDVHVTPKGGVLMLDSTALRLDVPSLFRTPPPAAAVRGRVAWTAASDGLAVHAGGVSVSNADAAVTGQFGLWLPRSGPPYLNLLLRMSRGNVVATRDYLPDRLLHPDLAHWLKTALVGGRVTRASLVLRGDPLRFPFRQHEGVFEARLQVRNGTLDYFPNWPKLTHLQGEVVFNGASLHAVATGGRLLHTRIDKARIAIADMERARLEISASGAGPAADVLSYLAHTPLGDGRQTLFDEMRAGGQDRLNVQVMLPLHEPTLKNWRLDGTAQVSDGAFALPAYGFALRNINGSVSFTQRSLSASGITADYLGQAVRLGASTRADGLSILTLDGRYSVAGLLGKTSPITRFAHGAANLKLALTLPMTSQAIRQNGVDVILSTDLRDVAVNLPAPLGKPAGKSRNFLLRFPVDRAQAPVEVRYGDALKALLRIGGRGVCHYLAAADIRYARGAPTLPAQGITLEARLPELDVGAWWALRAAAKAVAPRDTAQICPDSMRALLTRLRRVSLDVAQVRAFGRNFQAVKVDARRRGGLWRATVASKAVQGVLKIPVALRGGMPLRFDLSHLRLLPAQMTVTKAATGLPRLNPAELPALSGKIAQVDVDGRHLNNVTLVTTPLSDGLQIHQLRIAEPALQARISGDWRQVEAQDFTQMQIEWKTSDAGKTLGLLKFPGLLKGGTGKGVATLNWNGAPYAPALRTLTGQATIALKAGRVEEVNPGAARLLGLFNLSQLPRHLSSGFGSLFKKGFGFNTMNGDFHLRQGNAYTQNFAIDGASALIRVKGHIGLATQNFDVNVGVVPQIDSALPIAGTVLGGPAVGAVVYLLDRVLGIGKQLNKAAELKYHVGGSWSAPVIKLENVPHNAGGPNRHGASDNLYFN
ncbi:YhdP family protein [Acidihalobacter ferrooxydans]|uniref:TIGR02099 family protein n=1 Tax=Acidihalobacter ferrooxydans TaxID=1765967 RepID=A0A1P8UIK0_9GAMM|nr:YhdP family protein [Acidihalobacter ferrooxydans]APZ43591.1 TIGR02099 family protein [Acidihalobacter ferrooxydans]